MLFISFDGADSAFIVRSGDAISTAMEKLNKNGKGIAFVVDDSKRFVGTITDGDVRRAVLRARNVDQPVTVAMNLQAIRALHTDSSSRIAHLMDLFQLRGMPVVGPSGILVGIYIPSDVSLHTKVDVPVLIMAGGMGSRLLPLTQNVPKPLVSVNGTTSLDITLRRLSAQGFHRVSIALHHRHDMIRNHVEHVPDLGFRPSFIVEEKPLGSAGALALIDSDADEPVLVINADVVSDCSLSGFVVEAMSSRPETSIGVFSHEIQVPFGVVEVLDGEVAGFFEKPKLRQPIFAGISLISPRTRALVESPETIDMLGLLERALGLGQKIKAFNLPGFWTDIGSIEALDHVNTLGRILPR